MTSLALISDLMMRSQVAGAATRSGTALEIVSSAESLLARAAAAPPRLVILDLSHPGLEWPALISALKELLPAESITLAFGPHVHASRLAEAEEAGCDVVISRGQFHAQMESLLKQYGG